MSLAALFFTFFEFRKKILTTARQERVAVI